MFVRMENFSINSKSKRGLDKDDMHVVTIIESTTIVSLIPTFQLELVPMFFHMDSIKKFRNFIQSWTFVTIVAIVIGVRGIGDNKCEKTLLIIDREGEFDQNIFALGNNFKTEYQQLLEVYNGGQCVVVLNKNVIITSKEN
jgi:hypothetical protein